MIKRLLRDLKLALETRACPDVIEYALVAILVCLIALCGYGDLSGRIIDQFTIISRSL